MLWGYCFSGLVGFCGLVFYVLLFAFWLVFVVSYFVGFGVVCLLMFLLSADSSCS